MKLHYFFHSARTNLLYVFILVLVSSCTIYVPVTDDDGIYSSRKRESQVHKKKVIIADNSKSYKKFEENYFDKELKRLQQDYDTTDVFTEIDNYSSDNTNDDDYTYHNEDYDSNRGSWGYSDNNHVVIHLDFRPRFYNPRYHSPFWFDGWSYWDSYYNYYDYYPYYTWHRPRWNWRWNRWNSWRYGSYWDPFRPHYYGYAFYNPYNYWNNFPRYYRGYTPRNYRYGKRVAYNNRNYYSNTRSNTTRRYSSKNYTRDANGVIKFNNGRRSSNTIRRNTNSARVNSSIRNSNRVIKNTRVSPKRRSNNNKSYRNTNSSRRNNSSYKSSNRTYKPSSRNSSKSYRSKSNYSNRSSYRPSSSRSTRSSSGSKSSNSRKRRN